MHQVACFYPHHQDIGQPGTFNSTAGLTATLVKDIDSNKVEFWMTCGNLNYEVAYTTADFKGQWMIVAK